MNETEVTTDRLILMIGMKEIEIQILKEQININANKINELTEKINKFENNK